MSHKRKCPRCGREYDAPNITARVDCDCADNDNYYSEMPGQSRSTECEPIVDEDRDNYYSEDHP